MPPQANQPTGSPEPNNPTEPAAADPAPTPEQAAPEVAQPTPVPVVPEAPAPNPGLGPVPPASAGPISQADFLAIAKKKNRAKRILKIAAPIILIIGIAAGLYFSGLIPLGSFKTVSYDNGLGSTYKMSFYARHEVKEAPSLGLAGESTESFKALVAKSGKDGRDPIQVFIQDESKASAGGDTGLENCGSAKPVATVRNASANTDVNICDIGGGSEMSDYMYMALYDDEDRKVIVIITSTAINEEAMESPEKAKAALKNAKLDVYKSDIEKIVSSIKIESAE